MKRDHPRIRGNTYHIVFRCYVEVGSPPHTREHCIYSMVVYSWVGITPAYAGTLMRNC